MYCLIKSQFTDDAELDDMKHTIVHSDRFNVVKSIKGLKKKNFCRRMLAITYKL